MESIAGALGIGFIVFPIFLSTSLIRQLFEDDYHIAWLLVLGIAVSLIARQIFISGHLKRAVTIVAVFFTLLLTTICSLGNGVHDIGLMGFPIIIGFSSIILDQKQLILASVLALLGLTWLVIGEIFQFYEPLPTPQASVGDFVISALMIGIGGHVAFSLTSNMKDSLKKANNEIETSKSEAYLLADQVEQKEEIIEEIHRAVINSLGQIQHLIDFSPTNKDELKEVHESICRKILVIEVAHGILLKKRTPILLDIKSLLEGILSSYQKKYSFHIQSSIGETLTVISLDQAIHFGILFLEILHEATQHSPSEIQVSLTEDKETYLLNMAGLSSGQSLANGVVTGLLIKQLKGDIEKSEQSLVFTFKPSQKK